MSELNGLVEPHLNSDLYKSFQGSTDTLPYLEYINIHSDGSLLIGCSELTGRHWKGYVYFFKSGTEIKDIVFKPKDAIRLAASTNDGCFVGNSNKVLTCDDTGAVALWLNREFPPFSWVEDSVVHEHDDVVMAIDCLVPEETYVTVGADGHIKVWDVTEMLCVRKYESAHANIITGVSVKPESNTVMATASHDRTICLWDENILKPVQDVVESDCGIRCVKWLDEHTLIYGNEAGALCSVDVRNTSTINTLDTLFAPIHRVIVKPDKKHVAVCGDNKKVSVFDVSRTKSELLYENNNLHSNFVRGLAWDVNDNDTLISVGWDHAVHSHKYK